MEMIRVVPKKWGSSLGVVIPKEIAEKEGIKEGRPVDIFLKRTPSPADIKKSSEAWQDMKNLSKEISKRWSGPSAVEEIRNQRTKDYDRPRK